MTKCAGHVRSKALAGLAAEQIAALIGNISEKGFIYEKPADIITAVRLRHLSVTAMAVVESITALLEAGAGSRGSHLVLDSAGEILDELLIDSEGQAVRAIPENLDLRDRIAQVSYDATAAKARVCKWFQFAKYRLRKMRLKWAWGKI